MQRNTLSLAVIQANPTVGDIDGNLTKIIATITANRSADLVVFPECTLTGYPLQDLVLRPGFIARAASALEKLAAAVRDLAGPAVIIGAPQAGTDLPYNAAFLISPDGTMLSTQKVELPNSDVFDERRTFARGSDPKPLKLGDWNLGVMICEDMWHGPVGRALADEGADLLIAINGSPFEIGKQPVRIKHAQSRVRATGLPIIYANLTGGQDELVFDGASFALNSKGHLIAQLPFEETVLRFEATREGIDGSVVLEPVGPMRFTHVPYPKELEAVYRAMVIGVRDYVAKQPFFKRVLLGVSGGVDSALVAAIAADAIGGENVVGLMLPSEYTGGESKDLAEQLFARLGCRNGSIAIGKIAAAMDAARDEVIEAGIFGVDPDPRGFGLSGENAQSRSRGALLSNLANVFPGTLLLTTGNKSENSVGYCTLYGDTAGGYNPLKDAYKTLVFALCRWRNAHQCDWMKGPVDPIPARIIDRPPTAELKPEQTDEAALGAYDMLDAVLEGLVERMLDPAEAARQAAEKIGRTVEVAYAERIAHLVKISEFKRRQVPPGTKLTARPFGFGWRFPIVNAGSL